MIASRPSAGVKVSYFFPLAMRILFADLSSAQAASSSMRFLVASTSSATATFLGSRNP